MSAQNSVDAWLRAVLDGREADRNDVIHQGIAAGFSERSVDRAAGRIGVQKTVRGFGKQKRSLWSLPGAMPATPHDPPASIRESDNLTAVTDPTPISRVRAGTSELPDSPPAPHASPSRGGNGAHAPVDVGPSGVQRTFLSTFYRSATPGRAAEVLRLLAGVLTAHGAAYEGSRVRAMSRAHLDEECARLLKIPPRSPDKAIDFVLARLRARLRSHTPAPLEVGPPVAERR